MPLVIIHWRLNLNGDNVESKHPSNLDLLDQLTSNHKQEGPSRSSLNIILCQQVLGSKVHTTAAHSCKNAQSVNTSMWQPFTCTGQAVSDQAKKTQPAFLHTHTHTHKHHSPASAMRHRVKSRAATHQIVSVNVGPGCKRDAVPHKPRPQAPGARGAAQP